MKKKSLILLLTTAAVIGTVLSGCSDSQSSSLTDSADETTTEASDADADADAADETAEVAEDTDAASDTDADAEEEESSLPLTAASYEDLIGQLQSNNAYAYINVNGYDGELLAVAEFAFTLDEDHENAAIYANIYGEKDGQVELIGEVATGDTAHPIACENGILYVCNIKQYGEMEIRTKEDGSYELYYTKCANIIDQEDGSTQVETTGDITASDADEVYDMIQASSKIPTIQFQIVE